jgi:hypothetical protein
MESDQQRLHDACETTPNMTPNESEPDDKQGLWRQGSRGHTSGFMSLFQPCSFFYTATAIFAVHALHLHPNLPSHRVSTSCGYLVLGVCIARIHGLVSLVLFTHMHCRACVWRFRYFHLHHQTAAWVLRASAIVLAFGGLSVVARAWIPIFFFFPMAVTCIMGYPCGAGLECLCDTRLDWVIAQSMDGMGQAWHACYLACIDMRFSLTLSPLILILSLSFFISPFCRS